MGSDCLCSSMFQSSQTIVGFTPERFAIRLAETEWIETIPIMQEEQVLKRLPNFEQSGFGDGSRQPNGERLTRFAGDAALYELSFQLVEL